MHSYSWASQAFPQCDERGISAAIVQRYDLDATDVDADTAALLSRVPYVGPDLDEPFVGGFHGLTEQALQAAHNDGVRTVMTGHRGDLVVGGWIFDYLTLLRTGQWGRMWKELTQAEEKTGVSRRRAMLLYLWHPLRAAVGRHDYLDALRGPLRHLVGAVGSTKPSPSPFPAWVRPEYVSRYRDLRASPEAPDTMRDPMRRWRYESILMPSHMRVATLAERNGARHGITMTDPWSDRRLVEFAAAVPPGVLCQQGENKWIVRRALRGLLPEEVRTRLRKVDPYPLYEHALKVDLRSLIEDVYSTNRPSETRGDHRVDAAAIRTYLQDYGVGGAEDARFWYTLTLEFWLQRYHS